MKTSASPRGKRLAFAPEDRGDGRHRPMTEEDADRHLDYACDWSGVGAPMGDAGGMRALSWDDAVWLLEEAHHGRPPVTLGSGLPSPGIKFVHGVPDTLRSIGCMWLPDGREDRRCGRTPAWTMGANLNLARVYCELHGQAIAMRRSRIRDARSLRRATAGPAGGVAG